MFTESDVHKVMKKFKDETEPGNIFFTKSRGNERRYSYHFQEKLVFTFGLTRSSKATSKKFSYIPRAMKITNKEYRELYKCPWKKRDYNQFITDNEII